MPQYFVFASSYFEPSTADDFLSAWTEMGQAIADAERHVGDADTVSVLKVEAGLPIEEVWVSNRPDPKAGF